MFSLYLEEKKAHQRSKERSLAMNSAIALAVKNTKRSHTIQHEDSVGSMSSKHDPTPEEIALSKHRSKQIKVDEDFGRCL